MDAKPANSGLRADRGIAPPQPARLPVGRGADALPVIGYRVRGPGVVDGDAIGVLDGAEERAEGPWGGEAAAHAGTPFRKLSVLMPIYNERWTLPAIVRRVLASPVGLPIELVAVDDGSTDGSRELIYQLAQRDDRIKIVFHPVNRGKGAAIRTAIAHMTGDVAVIQDADLEYDPAEYPLLLAPILAGDADAVFGSRFVGHSRRVLFFWHSLMNRGLTFLANLLNNLNLTDMETCYKMVRADVLKRLRLQSHTFTIEPEITCRLAQWGARIYEVPISYRGRTYQEGKKIRAIDGLKALGEMVRCKFLDPQFTDHSGYYTLASVARAQKYNRWLLEQVQPFMGRRVLEAGSGIGNLSGLLLNHDRLVLVDYEDIYIDKLRQRYGARENVRVDRADLTNADDYDRWQDERLDTIVCSNVLEHLGPDVDVLRSFHRTLTPGGHCILVVPAGPWLYTPMDRELGHYRRYTPGELADKLAAAGFEVAYQRTVSRLGTIGWAVSGHVLRRRHLSARQMIWYDRLLPVAKVLDYVLPVPGMSLIMVGRKPAAAAAQMDTAVPRRVAA
jgi:glycosyltransferase involved in cell wall biosynthesis